MKSIHSSPGSELDQLQKRIRDLETENTRLQARVEELTLSRKLMVWFGLSEGSFRHNLARSVGTVKDLIWLIQRELNTQPSEKINEMLAQIEKTVDEIRSAALDRPGEEKPIEIQNLLTQLIEKLKKEPRNLQVQFVMRFTLEKQIMVEANVQMLQSAFKILLDNSLHALITAPHKEIIVSTSLVGNMVDILVEDTGIGIPEVYIPRLFTLSDGKENGKDGAGLGLYLASNIFQLYGGTIKLLKTSRDGTTFSILLPVKTNIN